MKLKRGFVVILVVIMVSLTFVQAFGQSLNDLKEEQKGISNQIDNTKKELQSTQRQAKKVNDEIRKLDEEVAKTTSDLHKVTKELEELVEDIEVTTEELIQAEENLEIKIGEFSARLRTMYKNGNVGYIEVLLSASDISDLLSRNKMIQVIADYDRELIEAIKEQKEIIEVKKAELEDQKEAVEITKSEIETQKAKLEKATREKQTYMASLEKDIDAYKAQQDDLLAEADKVKDLITAKQEEIEAARIAAEKKAAEKRAAEKKAAEKRAAERKAAEKRAAEKKAAEQEKPRDNSGGNNNPPSNSSSMAWPVPSSRRISSSYGYRIHPISGVNQLHTGIDIAAPSGTPIVAANGGTVLFAGWQGGYGYTVIIDHGGGIVTLYAHCSSLHVSGGQVVSRGQTIASMGSTGNSTGPHLHFEVRKNSNYVNPLPYIR